MDYSLPGSSVHEIPQARILEWVAMPSLVIGWGVNKMLSQADRVWQLLFLQILSSQRSFSEDLPNLGVKPTSPMSLALAGGFFTTGTAWEAPDYDCTDAYELLGRGTCPEEEILAKLSGCTHVGSCEASPTSSHILHTSWWFPGVLHLNNFPLYNFLSCRKYPSCFHHSKTRRFNLGKYLWFDTWLSWCVSNSTCLWCLKMRNN